MRSTVSQIRRKIVQVYERMSEWQLYITRIWRDATRPRDDNDDFALYGLAMSVARCMRTIIHTKVNVSIRRTFVK